MKKLFVILMATFITTSAFAGRLNRAEIKEMGRCVGATEVIGQYLNHLLEKKLVNQKTRDDIFNYSESVWKKAKFLLKDVKVKKYEKHRIKKKKAFVEVLKTKGTNEAVNQYIKFINGCDEWLNHELEQR